MRHSRPGNMTSSRAANRNFFLAVLAAWLPWREISCSPDKARPGALTRDPCVRCAAVWRRSRVEPQPGRSVSEGSPPDFPPMINDLWYKNAIIYCLSVGTYMDASADG